jgi:hypothetical protein
MKTDILPLLVCLFFTIYNIGVIWVLQLNHYPLYAKVGQQEFQDYMTAHNGRILLPIVLPSIAAFISSDMSIEYLIYRKGVILCDRTEQESIDSQKNSSERF